MGVKEALKMLRFELGMTQTDLAHKLNKAYITISRWENGRGFPSRSNAKDILNLARRCDASTECVSYLYEVLMPEVKRSSSAESYGFPDIDREFLFSIADGSANSVYVIEKGTYNLLYANRKAERISAKFLAELGNLNDNRSLANAADKRCFHYFGNLTEPCKFCPLQEIVGDQFADKVVVIPNSGGTFQIRAKAAKTNGKNVYVLYTTDLTDVMSERNALYEMTNDIPAGVGIYNITLPNSVKLVFMNTILFQMIGFERHKELLNDEMSDFRLIHPDDRALLSNTLKNSIALKSNASVDLRMIIRDGEYHRINLAAKLINRNNEKFTYYCIFREI